jgi:hypothetical protein
MCMYQSNEPKTLQNFETSVEGKGAGTLKDSPCIGFASDPSLLMSEHGEHGGQSQLAMHSHVPRDSENHVYVRR